MNMTNSLPCAFRNNIKNLAYKNAEQWVYLQYLLTFQILRHSPLNHGLHQLHLPDASHHHLAGGILGSGDNL